MHDAENRLRNAVITGVGATSVTYDYDALGRRVSKNVGGVSTNYLLNGSEEIGEYSGGTLRRRYITAAAVDDRIARVEGNALSNPTKLFYHVNHQGSVLNVVNAGGNSVQRIAYDEYGNTFDDPNQTPPVTGEPFRFTGRRYDAETGLYYYRARYYSPQIGRFLQSDTVGFDDDLNLYTYVGNDPLDRTDPSGQSGCADMNSQHLSGACQDASNFTSTDKKGGFLGIGAQKANAFNHDAAGTSATDATASNYAAQTNQTTGNEQASRIDTTTDADGKSTTATTPIHTDTPTPSDASFKATEMQGAAAIVHTHPTSADTIKPGNGDWQAPSQGVPNYVASGTRSVVVEISGGQVRIRVIAGKLTTEERRSNQQQLTMCQRKGEIY